MRILSYEQTVCKRSTKMEKGLLYSKMVVAMCWLYCSTGQEMISLLFKEKKRMRMDFWDHHVTFHEAHYRHAHSLRKAIIYCLPTNCFNDYTENLKFIKFFFSPENNLRDSNYQENITDHFFFLTRLQRNTSFLSVTPLSLLIPLENKLLILSQVLVKPILSFKYVDNHKRKFYRGLLSSFDEITCNSLALNWV